VLGRHHHLALHEAPGRGLRIGHRLLDGDPVDVFQGVQNRPLLGRVQVLDDVDDIVAFQIAHRVGQDLGGQRVDDFLTQAVVQFRQDLTVEFAVIELHQMAALFFADLFQKVSDVSGVQRLHQAGQVVGIANLDGIQNRLHRGLVQHIGVVVAVFFDCDIFAHPAAPRLTGTLGKTVSKKQSQWAIYRAICSH